MPPEDDTWAPKSTRVRYPPVRASLHSRLGPLQERPFRLLFSATTVTTLGDGVAAIALAFAILDLPGGTATQLGIVLGARTAANTAIVLIGGVVADRMPRNLVLAGASVLQGVAQAATAALVLSGGATLAWLIALQALYGVGEGLVIPAEVGLVPQTVAPERLQQANALQGLSRNVLFAVGPAIGGVLVVAGSPGVALMLDAATFFVCAALLSQIRLGVVEREASPGFLHELRAGWNEFTARTWLWATVVLFGVGNFCWSGCWAVLGPLIAKQDLGGAGAWATIVAFFGVGSIAGGIGALRIRPSRPLVASILSASPFVPLLVGLAFTLPVWLMSAFSFVGGLGLALHLTLWFTVFQQNVPEHAQSRVSSYDALGSFVLIPVSFAIVGPVAAALGNEATLIGAAIVNALCLGLMLLIPSVWAIRPRVEATSMAVQ
jgi:MFS family permease